MRIDSIIVERRDGSVLCGLLHYAVEDSDQYLPWTLDLQNPKKVVVTLFPSDSPAQRDYVHVHYQEMAGAIVSIISDPSESQGA
jgi:hypothetical protein